MKIKLLLVCTLMISQISTAQDFRFGKVSKKELMEKSHPLDSTADAAILYREMKTSFGYSDIEGFYTLTEVYERIKIYNRDGFDRATKKIKLYKANGGSEDEINNLKAVTYFLNKNNKIEEEKLRNDGIFEKKISKFLTVKKFTMPNVQESCVIEYEYTLKSPFIGDINAYQLQEKIPVNLVKVRFASPEYLVYKIHQKGWIPYKMNKSQESRTVKYRHMRSTKHGLVENSSGVSNLTFMETIYKTKLKNVPALKEESYVFNIENYATRIKFELSYTKFPNAPLKMFTTTWEDVSKTIYESDDFGRQLEITNYFEDDIDKLLEGLNEPQEKMIAIYEFVKQKMNWNSRLGFYSENGVRRAYEDNRGNTGDINLMLTAMFRYAGLDANPILVSTKSNGIPIFPTRNGFNYVLSGVKKDGSIILFDATNKFGKPNVIETRIMNWKGRIVGKDGSSAWVSLTPSKHAVRNTMITADLSSTQITGKSRNRYTGNYALTFRKNYNGLKKEAARKKLETGKNGTELSEIKFENLDQLYKPVNLSYNFESFGTVGKIGNKLYLSPMLFMAMNENPFKLEQRTYPIDYGFPKKDRYIITIDIPKTHKVESVPENVFFKIEDIASFKYLISNTGNKIQLSVEFSINKPLVVASKYDSLKKFYEFLIAKEKEKVVLAKI